MESFYCIFICLFQATLLKSHDHLFLKVMVLQYFIPHYSCILKSNWSEGID